MVVPIASKFIVLILATTGVSRFSPFQLILQEDHNWLSLGQVCASARKIVSDVLSLCARRAGMGEHHEMSGAQRAPQDTPARELRRERSQGELTLKTFFKLRYNLHVTLY